MRFVLGIALLVAIAAGLSWAWYRFVWLRHPSMRLRRATSPHDMIDITLAPVQDPDQRSTGAASARSTRAA